MTRIELAEKYGKDVVRRVTTRQVGGDDGYQWTVFVDGREFVNGCVRREANYFVEVAIKGLLPKEGR